MFFTSSTIIMIYIPAVLALSSFALAGWTSKTGESFHKNAVIRILTRYRLL